MSKAVYIHLEPNNSENLQLGASHWFGYPDMPIDIPIPSAEEDGHTYALSFICQINLKDLPSNARGLPNSGLLLFFADIAYYGGNLGEPVIGMDIANEEAVKVIYIPDSRMDDLVCRQSEYFEQDHAQAIPIRFDNTKPDLDEPNLQMFGRVDSLEWEDWPNPCEDWHLLLMMDSMEGKDYNYNFIDCGCLCFLINPDDLSYKDFSNVRAIILSS